jgi:hypothetical protein
LFRSPFSDRKPLAFFGILESLKSKPAGNIPSRFAIFGRFSSATHTGSLARKTLRKNADQSNRCR